MDAPNSAQRCSPCLPTLSPPCYGSSPPAAGLGGPRTSPSLSPRWLRRGIAPAWSTFPLSVKVSDLSRSQWSPLLHAHRRGARLQCKAWSSTLPRLKVVPSEAETVVLRGAGDFYGPQGKASFTVSQCEPAGAGALAEALAALERRLRAEGLFDSATSYHFASAGRYGDQPGSRRTCGLLRSQRLSPGIDILVAHSAVQGPVLPPKSSRL